MPISSFKADSSAARDGVWKKYSPNSDGSVPAIKIARNSRHNVRYTKAMRELVTQPDGSIDASILTGMNDEETTKAEVDLYCETIIMDWEHIQPNDGGVEDEIPFSVANAKSLLKHPDWLDLFDDIRAFASDATHYRNRELEDSAKNS